MKNKIISMILVVILSTGISVEALGWEVSERKTGDGIDMTESWMEYSWEIIKDKTYSTITIPTSHDSGTYKLDPNSLELSQLSSGISPTLSKVVDALPNFILDKVKRIIANVSLANEDDIETQLKKGARSLDIRFKRAKKGGKIRIFHGIFGEEPKVIFLQIKKFLDEHPKEIVLMELNSGGYLQDFDDEGKKELAKVTEEILGEYMIGEACNWESTMEDILNTGKRLVVTTTDDVIRTAGKSFTKNIAKKTSGEWPNIEDFDIMVERVYNHYNKNYRNIEDPDGVRYYFSTQMSPNGDEILDNIKNAALNLDLGILNRLLKMSLKGFVENRRLEYKTLLLTLGDGDGDNRANSYSRDFLSAEESDIIISKNYGKNKREIESTIDVLRRSGEDESTKKAIELGEKLLTYYVIPNERGSIDFYEGNDCKYDLLGVWNVAHRKTNLKKDKMKNDEVRSMRLRNVLGGTEIRVYDSPDGGDRDDVCVVKVKKRLSSYRVRSFEKSYEDEFVKVEYFKKNGLDGKISRIEID